MENRRKRWVVYLHSPGREPDPERVSRFLSTLENYTPWVEYQGGGAAYLELGGVRRLWGHPLKIIDYLQKELASSGFVVSFGLGSSKFLARSAAALAGEREVLWVLPRGEEDFIEGLAVDLWPDIRPETISQLRQLGIRRVGDLSLIDPFWVRRVWGESGLVMRQQARGFDPRPVLRKLPSSSKSFFPEQPALFPPANKSEKMTILIRLLSFFRQKYGTRTIDWGTLYLKKRLGRGSINYNK